MVVVQLRGGLGNQLFQYAAARRLAHANHASLKLDVSGFAADPRRAYSLAPFNIHQEFATPTEIARFKGRNLIARLVRRMDRLRPYHRRAWVVERQVHFDPNLLGVSRSVYLEGYWQSEKYFQDIAPILRAELRIKTEMDGANAEMADCIRGAPSVSVHIRRGDYASDPITRQTHGLCPIEYYYRAVQQLVASVPRPHFFIFSDDPGWARENLVLDYPATFVTHNSVDKAQEDLRLMSLCRCHIIANSSFSWWGAWLCADPGKIVFAPRRWFGEAGPEPRDLIPESWHRI